MTLLCLGDSCRFLSLGRVGLLERMLFVNSLDRGFSVRAMLRDVSLSEMFPENENLEIVKG